ncbi:MAG: hypothetical protein KF718_03385 [Polyangiaceae bacterium]|nr:hypothetical protein [Polyangiaceae bacterium]
MARRSPAKKLLVASLGVAAVVYGCKRTGDAGGDAVVGNLVAPEPTVDAAPEEPIEPVPEEPAVGNLVAPPPDFEEDGGQKP